MGTLHGVMDDLFRSRYNLPQKLATMTYATLDRLVNVEFVGSTTEWHLIRSVLPYMIPSYTELKTVIENLTSVRQAIENLFVAEYMLHFYENIGFNNSSFKVTVKTTLNMLSPVPPQTPRTVPQATQTQAGSQTFTVPQATYPFGVHQASYSHASSVPQAPSAHGYQGDDANMGDP